MKFRLLTLMLASAAVAAWSEDCPLVLNQRFRLRYDQWQVSQLGSSSATQATYEVEAGLPVFTYRLGALALNGAVEYNRLAYGSESDTITGIQSYGARISLFPYRPIKLFVDYQRTQSPDLFGSGSMKGEAWGAGLQGSSRILGSTALSYRKGDTHLEGGDAPNAYREGWSEWKLENHHRSRTTQVDFQAIRQEYVPLDLKAWRFITATLDTDTFLANDWKLRTRSQFQDSGLNQWSNVNASFYGPIRGAWHSLTEVSAGANISDTTRTNSAFASETLVYEREQWHTHTTGSYSKADTPSEGWSNRIGSFLTGASYRLTPEWRVHGDVGLSSLRQDSPLLATSKNLTSLNLGFARGGSVPELIRNSLFFLSDWSYDRRVRDEYPPDYIPSELAQEMLQRRMRQSGTFDFTADLWRMSDSSTNGVLDWARVTGQVQTRGNLTLFLMGDVRHDRGLAQPGLDLRSTDVLARGSYRLGATTLTASLGANTSHRDPALTPTGNAVAPGFEGTGTQSRYYSVGVTSRLWKIPIGALALRSQASGSPAMTTLSAWTDLIFRQISLRVRYQTARTEGGFRNDNLNLELLRLFDTICVRNWR
ncbi:hypothetical protein [Geothrix sp. SG200]|uniref:hypothetical protein n=1 Tax=Geothrix sp. SG200 TaxID=2922865 RepID=UPI001FADCE62|nr:hypothetical protein [Geothrix sp. SG200]